MDRIDREKGAAGKRVRKHSVRSNYMESDEHENMKEIIPDDEVFTLSNWNLLRVNGNAYLEWSISVPLCCTVR